VDEKTPQEPSTLQLDDAKEENEALRKNHEQEKDVLEGKNLAWEVGIH
jgi:hypothetical protein